MSGDTARPDDTVHCARCGKQGPRQATAAYPGALGEELSSRVCAVCWAEWQQVEVMVINELQLNFMDPRSLEILAGHMREFLLLDNSAESGE